MRKEEKTIEDKLYDILAKMTFCAPLTIEEHKYLKEHQQELKELEEYFMDTFGHVYWNHNGDSDVRN